MTLRELHKGQSATILKVGGEGALRQHFLDMGMIPGTQVTLQKYAPLGDPMELRIHGYELTLRLADAEQIEVAPSLSPSPEEEGNERKQREKSLPPWGEVGRGAVPKYSPGISRMKRLGRAKSILPLRKRDLA